jgi:hypothetical protein
MNEQDLGFQARFAAPLKKHNGKEAVGGYMSDYESTSGSDISALGSKSDKCVGSKEHKRILKERDAGLMSGFGTPANSEENDSDTEMGYKDDGFSERFEAILAKRNGKKQQRNERVYDEHVSGFGATTAGMGNNPSVKRKRGRDDELNEQLSGPMKHLRVMTGRKR